MKIKRHKEIIQVLTDPSLTRIAQAQNLEISLSKLYYLSKAFGVNRYTKLSEEQKLEVRDRFFQGVSANILAEEFNVGVSTIYYIGYGK